MNTVTLCRAHRILRRARCRTADGRVNLIISDLSKYIRVDRNTFLSERSVRNLNLIRTDIQRVVTVYTCAMVTAIRTK